MRSGREEVARRMDRVRLLAEERIAAFARLAVAHAAALERGVLRRKRRRDFGVEQALLRGGQLRRLPLRDT